MIARALAPAADTGDLLRRGLLGLAGLGIAGTAAELVLINHWSNLLADIVWVGMAVVGAAFVVVARAGLGVRVSPGLLRAARAATLVVCGIALVGVGIHVYANLDAAPLDRVFGATWDQRPFLEQVWLAATDQVGPAPTLAPGSLLEIALTTLLASIRLPA